MPDPERRRWLASKRLWPSALVLGAFSLLVPLVSFFALPGDEASTVTFIAIAMPLAFIASILGAYGAIVGAGGALARVVAGSLCGTALVLNVLSLAFLVAWSQFT